MAKHAPIDAETLAKGEPITQIVPMKNWNDKKRRWDCVICQAVRMPDGKEQIIVYDVGTAETQVEIDDWAREAMRDKPWARG